LASRPPEGLMGIRPSRVVSRQGGGPALALLDEAEIFDVEDLGDGEAVVDLGHVDVAGPTPAIA